MRIEAVSIVVCNYDGAVHLPHCLDALAALRGPVVEVLLVDNASTDDSVALVAERFPSVRIVHAGSNEGPARARNLGMREARSRWVLAVDNDAVLAPDALERLIAAAEADESAVIVQPRSVFDDEPARVHYDGGSFHYAGLIALRNFYRPLAEAEVEPDGRGTRRVDCAVSVALLVDRDVVLAAGGYDERYFILFEDPDLSSRVRSEGRTILSARDATRRHRGGTAGISFRSGPSYPSSRVFYHSRNRWLFLAKCYSVRTLLAALPGLAVYEVFWLAFALAGGSLGSWWRGKRAFFRLRASTRDLRHAAQRRRRVADRALLVAGPLTTTPAIAASPLRRSALGVLDFVLRAWWTGIGRHLAA